MMKLNTNIVLCFAHVYQTSINKNNIFSRRIRQGWDIDQYKWL